MHFICDKLSILGSQQDILLQFSFLSLIRVVFRTLPLMSSQHFHDKALFLRDFRNLALEKSVISVELLSLQTVAGLQPVAVTFPSQGPDTSSERGGPVWDVGAAEETIPHLWTRWG